MPTRWIAFALLSDAGDDGAVGDAGVWLRLCRAKSWREILPAFRRARWQSRCLNHRPEFADHVAQSVGDLPEGTMLDGVQ